MNIAIHDCVNAGSVYDKICLKNKGGLYHVYIYYNGWAIRCIHIIRMG